MNNGINSYRLRRLRMLNAITLATSDIVDLEVVEP